MNINNSLRLIWLYFLVMTLVGVGLALAFAPLDFASNWRTASRESAHLAPLPSTYHDAVVEVYAARAYG